MRGQERVAKHPYSAQTGWLFQRNLEPPPRRFAPPLLARRGDDRFEFKRRHYRFSGSPIQNKFGDLDDRIAVGRWRKELKHELRLFGVTLCNCTCFTQPIRSLNAAENLGARDRAKGALLKDSPY